MKENIGCLHIRATCATTTSSGETRATGHTTRSLQNERYVQRTRVFSTCYFCYYHKQRGNECDESDDGTCTMQEGCARCEGVEHLILVLLPRAVGERQRRAIRRDLRNARRTCSVRGCWAPASCAATTSSGGTSATSQATRLAQCERNVQRARLLGTGFLNGSGKGFIEALRFENGHTYLSTC